MSVAEIAWRVRSLVSANIDLIRIPQGWYPKLDWQDALALSDFKPGFTCSPASDGFGEKRREEPFLQWERRLVASADTIMANRISYFDLLEQDLGDPVDWHRDFSAGKSSPRNLSNLLDYRDFASVGDCKLVWEPNRHHQFVVLARAWRVTGERRYAEKVVELMCHWIEENPFGYGMNWKSPLELGIRLINWVWAIDLIRDADVFSESEWKAVLGSIYLAMWDTQRKFSRGSSANNHLIGEAAGVFVAASYFDSMPNSGRWRKASQKILERESIAQSFADGCSREHAFGYQFFVLQFLTISLLAARQTGNEFSAAYGERLHKMYRFMANICADTGRPPNFGDADDGYVLDLGERPTAARQLIAVGGHLFEDREIIQVDNSETAFWLLGAPSLGSTSIRKRRSSVAYDEPGYFVLRSGQELDSVPVRVFFDCAELGFGAIAAHGHADCLSFTLAVGGRELLVDSGTYDYFTHPEWRNYFRSTQAHNTVTVDGESQSESLGPFIWGHRADPSLIGWHEDHELVRVTGEHSGYTRLADPLVHRRSVALYKASSKIEIRDLFSAKRSHSVQAHFHVAPGCAVERLSDSTVAVSDGSSRLRIHSNDGTVQVLEASDTDRRGWISNGYHRREPSHCIVIEADIEGDSNFLTRIDIG
jgi:hypothetical protein